MIEKTIEKKSIYEGKILNLSVHKVETKNGTSYREIVEHRGAVCAVPVNKNGKIVLVKQFRKAAEDFLLEIPAGKLEVGEKPEEAVKRELKEETGYDVLNIEYVTKFYTSPGFANEIIYLYIADLGEKGDTNFDEGEDIEIFEYDIQDLLNMIKYGDIIDAKTVTGILLYNSLRS